MAELSYENLLNLKNEFITLLKNVSTKEEILKLKTEYLGRKGKIRQFFNQLSSLSLEERKKFGKLLNDISEELHLLINDKLSELKIFEEKKEKDSVLLLSLPGVSFPKGKLHPLQKVLNEIINSFISLGFVVEEGPEIEYEDYNFTMLNIPKEHPARDMQDTLYLSLPVSEKGKILLRTHTSPVQIRVMLDQKPPIKAIMPGRVYRYENIDQSHLFNFHQVEGLVVDKNVKLSDLKGVLTYFAKDIFGNDIKLRFRQSYFPFTEPSIEMDIECLLCKGNGCSVCKNSGYLELLGCGMVNPAVFEHVGYGRDEYTGFAFGLGVERVAMLKYRINDIRLFYINDVRFLDQF